VGEQTFVAKDLVNFLCDHLGIRDRVEATRCAQDWMDASVFYHVNRTEIFADGEGLYRFREDEVRSSPSVPSSLMPVTGYVVATACRGAVSFFQGHHRAARADRTH